MTQRNEKMLREMTSSKSTDPTTCLIVCCIKSLFAWLLRVAGMDGHSQSRVPHPSDNWNSTTRLNLPTSIDPTHAHTHTHTHTHTLTLTHSGLMHAHAVVHVIPNSVYEPLPNWKVLKAIPFKVPRQCPYYSVSWRMLMTIKLREYIVTLVLFSLSTSSKPEPEPELALTILQYK